MEITRKEAIDLINVMHKEIQLNGYTYWITFKGKSIPYNVCMHVLEQFVECPGLSKIEVPDK